ncbi:MAG TPA: hypothetical protein VFX45_09920 [Solirubrobacterales bacterium]|nr:hypothetical protein [Solirubrobacterales bacterium]
MAEDGSGGVVYLRTVGGRKHVFAVPFREGAWGAPQRIDIGQEFDSSWARIGAGDKGRLIVTWVQEFGIGTDRMFSATLDPGADSFQAPVPVDFNVGEATSSYPDLAMNAGGQAYLTYAVVTNVSPTNPPGYVGAQVRVARYSNRLWSVLGNPVNRNPAAPLRQTTEANGPRVGIDVQGNAVVAWQEPDDEFVDRIWARRLFGATQGIALLASPNTWEGAPLRGPADAFALDVAGFGQAAVAVRQQPGQASRLTAPRLFVNEMPDAFAKGADAFKGARLVDGGVPPALGVPSVGAEPNGGFIAGFGSGFDTALASGDLEVVNPVERLDEGGSATAGDPLVDLAETGASVAVWKELRGSGLVGVQERRSDAVTDPAALSAPGGGAIDGLRLGGSGLGDAIIAWTQGSGANAKVAAAVVDAPPDPFFVQTPEAWKRQSKVTIHWAAAVNAIGSITYSVSVDDEPVGKPTRKLFAKLLSKRVGDGRHRIQVFAIDSAGQETGSHSAIVKVDRKPPKVKVKRRGRSFVVSITDGSRRETAGLKGSAVKISFGDGGGKKKGGGGTVISRASRKKGGKKGAKKPVVKTMRHTYSRPGSYVLRISARDRAGNVTEIERKVQVG